MSDKTLEDIISGKDLQPIPTENPNTTPGLTTEQRNDTPGLRKDIFTKNNGNKD